MKKAILTGGSRGIGLAIIKALLADGYEVWYLSRTPISEEIAGTAHHLSCDVMDRMAFEKALKTATEEAGEISLLVNDAGITRDGLIMRMKDADWDDVLKVNLTSVFLSCRALSRQFLRQRYGVIINIASVVGIVGNPGQANYAASKAGIIGLSKSLAKEFASRNIRVNCIAPGFIDTSMTQKLNEEQKKSICDKIPLGYIGDAEQVAKAVRFLASADASYITGQVLAVDGGMTM
jgi:3-oxoacyl-[acyl-carrier protein] reductase